jgi:structure-specific recognition protein 1
VKVDGEEGAAKAEGVEGEGVEGEYAEDDEDADDDGADGDGDPDAGLDGEGEEEEEEDDDDDDDDEDCRPAQRKPHSRRAAPPAAALAAAAAGSRKPQTAYMLFVNARRAELMVEHPGIKMPEVGRRCGEMWRSMGLEQRAEYQVCLPLPPSARRQESSDILVRVVAVCLPWA